VSNIFSNLKDSMSTWSFSMNNSFWNSLSIETRKFINKCEILKKNWSIWSRSHWVLVVINWGTVRCGQSIWFHLIKSWFS
jgi:hypothetical protein